MDGSLQDQIQLVKGVKVKRFVWAGFAIAAILLAILLYWLWGGFLPDWIEWKSKALIGQGRNISLENRSLTIDINGGSYYKSPMFWHVQDFLVFDINGDGKEELIMLVWKQGSYGKHRPTWVEHDEIDFSQHLFIYSFLEDRLKPIWQSSKLGIKVETMEIAGERTIRLYEPEGAYSDWIWLSWGLVRKDE